MMWAILIMIIIIGVASPIVFIFLQKNSQEQKNYERALKAVPLLIHLPPISEDIQGGGRDVRDVADESISKAQIIYNIIASTYQKGFKNRINGQRYFGFEIVGSQGSINFYAIVPIVLIDVVKQAIISAYPSAQLEEVAEHNIFNKVGKLNGVTGGEFVLKQPFAYPIATYQDLKRDSMQAILNSLSTLEKEDGAAIQILLRPADPAWRKTASGLAGSKRKGEESSGGMSTGVVKHFAGYGRDIIQAFFKPPEPDGPEKEKDKKKELSSMDQAVLDSIDDKTRYPGYEVLIRLVASSNTSQSSQAITNNMTAAFSLFDAPSKNGFKFVPTKEASTLVSSYILRSFPQQEKNVILNSVELATLFHFPDQNSIPTSQLKRQESKQVDGPRNIPEEGILLGYNLFRGIKKPIRLSLQDRQRHMYVVGQTGTGKSTFLEGLAFQDMLIGNGFAYVDPHGDSVEKLLALIPKERTEDIIYFSPADMDYPMGLNLFEFTNPDQKDFLIQETLNMLQKLYDPQHTGIMGPRYEHLFRNAALTVMADPAGGTFVDIPKLFRDPQYVKQKLVYVKDPSVREFWEKEMLQAQRSNEFGDVVSWFVSKFGAFLSNDMMRNIIGQTKSAFDLRDIMDNKKILLVNLSKGRTGQLNMQLLGMIFVMKFQAAAMSRANVPEDQRDDFSLYVDEFQNFSTDSFATILSEARKYHLNLIAANQFTTQLSEEIRDAVFGNVGTTVAFRVGDQDADSLNKYFRPVFDETDILRLPNFNTIVRTMINGIPTQPFSMATLPPLGSPNEKLPEAIKQLSAAKYGRPRAVVESEIFARMTTKLAPEPAKPAFGGGSFGAQSGPAGSSWPARQAATPLAQPLTSLAAPTTQQPQSPMTPVQAAPKPAAAPGSFLDDWIAKRKARPQNLTANPVSTSTLAPVANNGVAQSSTGSNNPAPSPATANISSDSLDETEINKIAKQLKSDLEESKPLSPAEPPTKASAEAQDSNPLPVQPPIIANENSDKIEKGSQPVKQKEFEFPIKNAEEAKKHEDADTIYIDQDGNLRLKDDT